MFSLLQEELNCLKLAPHASAASCWLTVLSPGNFMCDMAGNPVVELPNILRTPARYLGIFVDNTAGPWLVNITLQEFILMFDEPIDSTGFDVTGITV